MLIEHAAALGVHIKDVECTGAFGKLGLNATEKLLEDGGFERVKEEKESRGAWEVVGEGVLFEKTNRG